MSLALVYSRAKTGIEAPLVTVETHISGGLPRLSIVGLPETAVKESKDRVRSAIINSRFDFPQRRITINLAPADLPKEGGRFDLAIALSILVASRQLPKQIIDQFEFIGELGLDGSIRAVSGSLPAALQCAKNKRTLVVPGCNAAEACLPAKARVVAANHLLETTAHLTDQQTLPYSLPENTDLEQDYPQDLCDVKGQHQAKRALEVAASGGHNLLMVGTPGTGKTMLASRLPTLLPILNEREAMEIAAVRSVANQSFDPSRWRIPAYRAPHHTASAVALVGGGSHPKPGEISLAHNGILFLDELPEFERRVLEVLREPMEAGEIVISRANEQVTYPANFQLVAAMNPCPCGYLGDKKTSCRCTPDQINRYRQRISGPLLDRIDLQIAVTANTREIIDTSAPDGPTSREIRQRVTQARNIQLARQGCINANITTRNIGELCSLDAKNRALLRQAIDKLNLSARAYHRILKIARTIADMDASQTISREHLMEALSYRNVTRTKQD